MKDANRTFETPISPLYRGVEGWQDVPIIENEEKLISINELESEHRIVVYPQYYYQGIVGATPQCYARESVVNMLISASLKLPDDLQLVIWDAWRPLSVQQALYDDLRDKIRQRHPDLNENELSLKVSTYVSLPSQEITHPSPHVTGGSVDLSIMDRNGNYLPMGTAFDDFSTKAHTRYYEDSLYHHIDLATENFKRNRRLLYHVMIDAGFTNYPNEWWHYDYGNQFWATVAGHKAALYAICSPDIYNEGTP